MGRIFKNDRERSEWLYQLGDLLQEGFSLSEALVILKTYQTGKKQEWCESLYEALTEGDDLANQLHLVGFSKEITSYILFHERYGDLKIGLQNGGKILEKKNELVQKGRKLLSYPLFLIFCLLFMVTIMSSGVFPHLQSFYQSMNQELPWITRVVIWLLSLFEAPILLLFSLLLLILVLWIRKLTTYERLSLLLRIPGIKAYTTNIITYYLSSHLSLLLQNGFSLFKSLQILQENSILEFLQSEAQFISEKLMEGVGLEEIFQERPFYEPQLAATAALGEAKGTLGKELERYSNFLQHQLFDKTQKILGALQPILFSIIGIIVLILFLSMMLPIFNIVEGW